jgi:hypothetical protein
MEFHFWTRRQTCWRSSLGWIDRGGRLAKKNGSGSFCTFSLVLAKVGTYNTVRVRFGYLFSTEQEAWDAWKREFDPEACCLQKMTAVASCAASWGLFPPILSCLPPRVRHQLPMAMGLGRAIKFWFSPQDFSRVFSRVGKWLGGLRRDGAEEDIHTTVAGQCDPAQVPENPSPFVF